MTEIHAKRALTPDGWLPDVCIRFDGGRIAAIEPAASGDTEAIVIPGLGNAHSHAFQRALAGHAERSLGSEDSFWTWRELMYRLAADMTPARLHAIACQLYADMLAGGYTSVTEFHYLYAEAGRDSAPDEFLDALLAAADETGIRLVYVPVFYERAGFDAPLAAAQRPFALSLDAYLDHCNRARTRLPGRHALGVGAHSLRAVSAASLAEIERYSAGYELPLHIHAAEQPKEVSACEAYLGARPVQWLLDHANVDGRWTIVHATHIDEKETAGLAVSGAIACLCPSTEANLADGVFPLQGYLARGGRIAIGSDSQVSLDPFAELRWLEYGQRLTSGRRNLGAVDTGHTGADLFRRAWAGGERSAGRAPAGIAAGAPADCLVLDGSDPLFAGHRSDTLLDAQVFTADRPPVDRVFVDGRECLSGGRHPDRATFSDRYRDAVEAIGLSRALARAIAS